MSHWLRGRVVLVLGAGDRSADAAALHLAARGAAIVVAGPRLDDVVRTAGLVAAQGGIARVIEAAAPPCLGYDLLRRSAEAHEFPTDVVVSARAFPSFEAARRAADVFAANLPLRSVVTVVEDAKAFDERAATDLVQRIAAAANAPVVAPGPGGQR